MVARCCVASMLASATASGRLGLSVGWASDGASYTIRVDDAVWFESGPMYTTVGGVHYAAGDGTLVHVDGPTATTGSDEYGPFTSTSHSWTAGEKPFITAVRVYESLAIFRQSWPEGAEGTASADPTSSRLSEAAGGGAAEVSSCFPSINVASSTMSPLGYLSFSGRFLESSKAGALKSGSLPGTGQSGGPFVTFSNATEDALVFSAASNFMEASWGGESDRKSLCAGLMATVTSVPLDYAMETMVYLGQGLNGAVRGYGQALMARYGTKRSEDYTLKNLGYSTDNGAYYYYHTEDGKNYEDTLLDVKADADANGIPYNHLLLDSYWYTKGKGGGVAEWDETSSTFPNGLESFHNRTGWQMQMHNRHWSNNNVYAKENGGKYDFILEDPLSIPNDQQFWDDLIANKSTAGIAVYEQDWMYNEWQGLNATLQSPTLGDTWLTQMGKGAEKSGVSVQYCMTFARMVVHSVQVGAVTQFRAGDDYHPGQTGYYPTAKDPTGETGCTFPYCVYYIGTTSILAWALDLAPAKDDFWSTAVQPDSPYRDDPIEPYNEMEAAISAYSTGPVQPSDAIGHANASLILMTCTATGRLLQPSAPARTIDACFREAALGDGSGALGPVPLTRNNHAVMATHTEVGGLRWLHVLAIGLAQPFALKPSHVAGDVGSVAGPVGDLVAWSGYGSRNVTLLGRFSEDKPMQLAACGYADFGLVHAAPVFAGGVALLGEVSKLVPVAVARILAVTPTDDAKLAVHVSGSPGEVVELAFASGSEPAKMEVSYSLATLGADGKATISGPAANVFV